MASIAAVMSSLLNYCYGIVVFLFDLQGWNCELNWVMGIDFDGGDRREKRQIWV
jgi:hypothetical protein